MPTDASRAGDLATQIRSRKTFFRYGPILTVILLISGCSTMSPEGTASRVLVGAGVGALAGAAIGAGIGAGVGSSGGGRLDSALRGVPVSMAIGAGVGALIGGIIGFAVSGKSKSQTSEEPPPQSAE